MPTSAMIAIADGSEEMEAIIVADVLRRAAMEVTLVSVKPDSKAIIASRSVTIVADAMICEVIDKKFDVIVLPGGMPGATNLHDSKALQTMLHQQAARDGWIAAICAAPAVVLQQLGLLDKPDGKVAATCHPAFHAQLETHQHLSRERVVVDGNIITSQAPGTAFEFALKLIELLCGDVKRDEVAGPLVLPPVLTA